MALIQLRDVKLGFGHPPLLDGIDLTLEPGERVALLGRNGSGKSTLLSVLTGAVRPDAGDVSVTRGTTIARLDQAIPDEPSGPLFEVIARGLDQGGDLLNEWHRLTRALAQGHGDVAALEDVQHRLEASGGWNLRHRVEEVSAGLGMDCETPFENLSGGFKRRVFLARALVSEPHILLLDEPTNHLDLSAIRWLEERLLMFRGGLLFVTHDRAFLRKLATRVVELDRGRLWSFPGHYDSFLQRKSEALRSESLEWARFDKKLEVEEVWIRKGVEARRTRNEGRVRALLAMREERRKRRERSGSPKMAIEGAGLSGAVVFEAEGLCHAWDDRPLIQGFSTLILRGEKVGIVGPNGCGKSTLLGLLLGQIPPDSGSVRHGTKLEIAFFDQMRTGICEEKNVVENVADGTDRITIGGRNRHILGYLEDFLFTPDRARQPVSVLSGGERARLLLARLFSRPSNVLVLDEPTNDLDVETLEVLESLLVSYPGVVLLVSHDRVFLDNVVTGLLVFEGDGCIVEHAGGFSEWEERRLARMAPPPPPAKENRPSREERKASAPSPRKITFKEKKELEALPGRIESLEEERALLLRGLEDPMALAKSGGSIAQAGKRLEILEAELAAAYARWEELLAVEEGG